ncbi:MAG: VWA domain-containing protein [Phycisphaerales bacterium]|nr:VWA domain-containing protein [Planctomycetota bacterium]
MICAFALAATGSIWPGSLVVERPLWLGAFALAGVVMAVFAWRFGVMGRTRRAFAAMIRLMLMLILGACLSGLSLVRTTNQLTVVAVVDRSESVRRFGSLSGADFSERIAEWLERAQIGRGADDLLGVVVFDAKPFAEIAPSRARFGKPALTAPGTDGTSIESALRLAQAMLPPDSAGRIVLFSDGNQTTGDALKAAREISSGGRPTPIDVVPLDYRLDKEVYIASVDAPAQAPAQSSVRLRVSLFSTGKASGVLRIISDGPGTATLASEPVSLDPGENTRSVQVPLGAGRVHRFRAVFEPDTGADGKPLADTLPENNAASAFTLTPGSGSVLVLHGGDRDPSPLAKTLGEEGFQVEPLPARLAPADPLTLQGYDLVILENVGAEELPEQTQRLLASAVRDLGLGLVMVGGDNSFGAGGWRNTPLEPVLPVLLDLPERLVEPEAAVIFVLDNSGSMNAHVMGSSRSQQEIANQAAAVSLGALDRRDLVGVIAFNSNFRVVRPLAPNSEPAATASAILSIGSGGGTNLGPALVEASNQLKLVRAKTKYVIVLSDGVSQDKDRLPEIAESMASRGIKLSCIAVGDDADTKGMEQIATLGGGQFFEVTNPAVLPRVFMRAMKVVRSPMIREEPFDPVVLPTGAVSTVGLGTPPRLLGLCLTQPRPDPTVTTQMVTPAGEPVLSQWRVELGQVAAFTSDAGRWAADWIDWPGYRRLWSQLARSIARSQSTSTLSARAQIRGGELFLEVENPGAVAGHASIPATVFTPSGGQIPVRCIQTAPSLFEARLSISEEGPYIAVIRPQAAGSVRPLPIVTGASSFSGREIRQLASTPALLAEIASRSGGRVRELAEARPAAVFDRGGITPVRALSPLWPILLFYLPLIFLVDIANRRVAWDRWLTRDSLESLPRSEASASQRLADRIRKGQPQDAAGSYQGLQLTNEDAQKLASRARDQRRAAILSRVSSSVQPPPPGDPMSPPPQSAPESSDPLLAAKKRARARFDENP